MYQKKQPVNREFTNFAIIASCRSKICLAQLAFDAHCCHMGTAIKHPVPDRVKPSFLIFDIRALWCSRLSVRVPGCQKLWHGNSGRQRV